MLRWIIIHADVGRNEPCPVWFAGGTVAQHLNRTGGSGSACFRRRGGIQLMRVPAKERSLWQPRWSNCGSISLSWISRTTRIWYKSGKAPIAPGEVRRATVRGVVDSGAALLGDSKSPLSGSWLKASKRTQVRYADGRCGARRCRPPPPHLRRPECRLPGDRRAPLAKRPDWGHRALRPSI